MLNSNILTRCICCLLQKALVLKHHLWLKENVDRYCCLFSWIPDFGCTSRLQERWFQLFPYSSHEHFSYLTVPIVDFRRHHPTKTMWAEKLLFHMSPSRCAALAKLQIWSLLVQVLQTFELYSQSRRKALPVQGEFSFQSDRKCHRNLKRIKRIMLYKWNENETRKG